ncbi:hypothetical protein [Streptomyces sp. NPDC059631]|uniref:hypothetical protein n=1 Tax=unclassified Streptomyces TaxID=2593676 RepID=UPI0036B61FA7
MTAVPAATALPRVASEAALAVPGVAALDPRLTRRLAAAAAPARPDATPRRVPPEAAVRAGRAPDGTGWHIEVRCVLSGRRRALDVARDVHDRVAAAAVAHLTMLGAVEPVTVEVVVTGVVARQPDAA